MSIRGMQVQTAARKNWLGGSRQEGSALIVALLFLVVSTAVAAGIAALASSAAETSADLLDSERAFYAAESARMRRAEEQPLDLGGDVHGDNSGSPGDLGCKSDEIVYRGWVGSDWGNANARHAICGGDGGGDEPGAGPIDEADEVISESGSYIEWLARKESVDNTYYDIGGALTVQGTHWAPGQAPEGPFENVTFDAEGSISMYLGTNVTMSNVYIKNGRSLRLDFQDNITNENDLDCVLIENGDNAMIYHQGASGHKPPISEVDGVYDDRSSWEAAGCGAGGSGSGADARWHYATFD